VLGWLPGTEGQVDIRKFKDARTVPGLVVYRFDDAILFFNADYFKMRLLEAVQSQHQPKAVLFDAEAVTNIDVSGIAKHLPSLFKRFNYRHVSSLDSHEYAQMHFHINQVLQHDLERALDGARNIDIPVLFVNGDRDEYTTAEDARQFGKHVGRSQFSVIRDAGHFLDMENKTACENTRSVLLGFLKPTVREPRHRYHPVQQGQHALAI